MEEQMNLLDILGVPAEAKEKKGASEKTKEKAVTTKKEKTATAKKEQSIALPTTIYAGPYTFSLDGEGAMTLKEVEQTLLKKYPELKGAAKISVKNKKCLVSLKLKKTDLEELKSGGYSVKLGTTMLPAHFNTGIEAAMEWMNRYPEYHGCSFHIEKKTKVLIPFMESPKIMICRDYPTPVTIGFPDHSMEIQGTSSRISAKEIMETYTKEHPEYEGYSFVGTEAGLLIPIFESPKEKTSNLLVTLPIRVATGAYSFLFTDEDFAGKTEVSIEDIRSKLEEHYPEYTKERTTMEYDEKHFIVAILKSSKKGIVILPEKGCGREYLKDGILEYRPYGRFVLKDDTLSFRMNQDLKIPASILKDIIRIFQKDPYQECAIQVFLNKDRKKYFLYRPTQTTTATSVHFQRNEILESECILVMDAHSHGVYPAFFSEVDNLDEKGIRLYMVLGNMNQNKSMELRAGMNGKFQTLDFQDVFEL